MWKSWLLGFLRCAELRFKVTVKTEDAWNGLFEILSKMKKFSVVSSFNF